MTVRLAQPLPECGECGRPTRRAVYDATGGRCTECAAWATAPARVDLDDDGAGLDQLSEWQTTVARIRRGELLAAAERARRRRLRRRG